MIDLNIAGLFGVELEQACLDWAAAGLSTTTDMQRNAAILRQCVERSNSGCIAGNSFSVNGHTMPHSYASAVRTGRGPARQPRTPAPRSPRSGNGVKGSEGPLRPHGSQERRGWGRPSRRQIDSPLASTIGAECRSGLNGLLHGAGAQRYLIGRTARRLARVRTKLDVEERRGRSPARARVGARCGTASHEIALDVNVQTGPGRVAEICPALIAALVRAEQHVLDRPGLDGRRKDDDTLGLQDSAGDEWKA